VAHCRPEGAGAVDGESRVECEAGLNSGTRLVKSTKVCESGGQHNFDAGNFRLESILAVAGSVTKEFEASGSSK
jgi:hypothetical protein